MTYEGPVRREDLKLRAQYVELDTTIYKIGHTHYQIYVKNIPTDFELFSKSFKETKIIGIPVELTNQIPEQFQEIIASISDKEIAKNFEGLMMNSMDLLNLLVGKFPKVFFSKIKEERGKVIVTTCEFKEEIEGTIYSRFLSEGTRKEIIEFSKNLKLPFELEIIQEKVDAPPQLNAPTFENPVNYIFSNGFKMHDRLDFTDRDQTLWFENIEKIYEGKFKKSDLYFFNENDYSCYVDYGTFENIDIRNHLFLYQTVYVTLPYEKNIPEWLKSKKISTDEFLELIKRNRIKVILNQPEFRQDTGFLSEIYKANPNAIISRRAIAALNQIDIVEISDNYLFNSETGIKEIKELCEATSNITSIDRKLLYELLVWPIKARRTSFTGAHTSSMVAVPGYGVNNVIQDRVSKAANKDFSLEFMITAPAIHLANALNATYFPVRADGFTDYYFANVMGTYLNLYKNATISKLQSFIDSRSEINAGIPPINPIEIFDVNDHISILELNDEINEKVDFDRNRRFMESLASLTPEQRKEKIEDYNRAVLMKLRAKKKGSSVIDLGSNVFMDIAGKLVHLDFLGSILSGVMLFGKGFSSKFPELKRLGDKINEERFIDKDKSNIHYLTKINRVARVRDNSQN